MPDPSIPLAAACAALLFAQLGPAQLDRPDLYVHPTLGSDDASGTKTEPLRTISAAVARVPAIVEGVTTIHLAAGTYVTTGGRGMPPSNLILSRGRGQGLTVGVAFAGEDSTFSRPALPGEVVLDWPSTPLVLVRSGEWTLQDVQLGTRSYPNTQEGVLVEGGDSLVHLRNVRIHTGSLSGAGIGALRGAEVRLYGTIELNEDLHSSNSGNRTFCRVSADYHGAVRFRDAQGTLSVGDGSLSATYYGTIELGCASAAITSWSGQANTLAVNNSGRIDLQGTPTTIAAKLASNTEIGLEHDGHVLAEGAQIIIQTQAGMRGQIVLQKASTLFGGTIVIQGPSQVDVAGMSGSVVVAAAQGALGNASGSTGAYVQVTRL